MRELFFVLNDIYAGHLGRGFVLDISDGVIEECNLKTLRKLSADGVGWGYIVEESWVCPALDLGYASNCIYYKGMLLDTMDYKKWRYSEDDKTFHIRLYEGSPAQGIINLATGNTFGMVKIRDCTLGAFYREYVLK